MTKKRVKLLALDLKFYLEVSEIYRYINSFALIQAFQQAKNHVIIFKIILKRVKRYINSSDVCELYKCSMLL